MTEQTATKQPTEAIGEKTDHEQKFKGHFHTIHRLMQEIGEGRISIPKDSDLTFIKQALEKGIQLVSVSVGPNKEEERFRVIINSHHGYDGRSDLTLFQKDGKLLCTVGDYDQTDSKTSRHNGIGFFMVDQPFEKILEDPSGIKVLTDVVYGLLAAKELKGSQQR